MKDVVFSRNVPLKSNDLVLLAFSAAGKPCFDAAKLPVGVDAPKAPKEAGASATEFVGMVGKKRIVVRTVRLDAKDVVPALQMKKAVSAALTEAKTQSCGRVVVLLSAEGVETFAEAVQEGAALGGYAFDRYLEKKADPASVVVASPAPSAALSRRLKNAKVVFEYVNFARDMANDPPNACRPSSLSQAFRKKGKAAGLTVSVWDSKRLQKEKCEGPLNVGRGSIEPPCMVIGKYGSPKAKKHLCLVGKGVTYDSGGYSLKGAPHQKGMKYDMSGSALMWSAACAIAHLKLPIRLTVITPLAENRISDDAYLVDDVLRFRNGTTVEIMNTDAEGRLLLADALVLAGEAKPDYILDAATLTGACVVGLGEDIAGVIGTDSVLAQRLVTAGKAEDERFCELPLHMPYDEGLKSTIADCKNGGGGYGGSITATLFLKRFVPDSIPWLHLDIAGPGCKEDVLDHLGKGAKGFGVKTLVRLAAELA